MERVRPRKKKQIPVDERLVSPHQRAELVCGELIMTPPAGEPHARAHIDLGALLSAHVASGYLAAVDMLTRVSETSDFAPDASIYPEARDAEGHRQLEVMAFEIVSRQRRAVATNKAIELARRGVRRIFCIDLNTHELLEWTGSWSARDLDFVIEDLCLSSPLRVSAVLNAAERDDAVVQALHQRGNAYIEQLIQDSHQAGRASILVKLFERRLDRTLSLEEVHVLAERLRAHGEQAVLDVVLGTPEGIQTWLTG